MKDIGKPCAGKPQARFDEGGLAITAMAWLFRHRQTKGTETDKPAYCSYCQFSTLPLFQEPIT
ncbi:MAG: hypothetical protein AAB275_06820, partial [Deltaproteobacteria bacterium]